VSPIDATASSAGRGEGAGFGTRAPDDATNPAGFAVGESGDPLTKRDRTRSWPDDGRRETVPVDAAPTSAYVIPPGYGPAAPAGGYPGTAGPLGGAAHPAPGNVGVRGQLARRARLKIARLGPLSVLRISLTFALCMFIVLLVAVAALWAVLDTSGVFRSIIKTVATLTSDNKNDVAVAPWLSFGRVMLITVVIGAANVIALTLLSTIGALLYNLCSDFVGGVEVTLIER
jgi:hypothetical protein